MFERYYFKPETIDFCSALRVFLRYLHQEDLTATDCFSALKTDPGFASNIDPP
jgi:hypothetical protein